MRPTPPSPYLVQAALTSLRLRGALADSGFALNGAMFSRNGRSGYVLKPANLRFKNKEAQNTVESHTLVVQVRRARRSVPTHATRS